MNEETIPKTWYEAWTVPAVRPEPGESEKTRMARDRAITEKRISLTKSLRLLSVQLAPAIEAVKNEPHPVGKAKKVHVMVGIRNKIIEQEEQLRELALQEEGA